MLNIIKKEDVDVKLLIAKRGINQKDFANNIGISQSYLSQLVNGLKKPSPATAGRIAKALKVDVNEIFFITSGNK
jgi:transcriptional regulator with XRE-family HTH domain